MSPSDAAQSPTIIDQLIDPVEYQQITRQMYEHNAELVKLDKVKDEFVSLTSHELRTPLTIIKNYLWMALNKPDVPLGPQTEKYLHTALGSVDRLVTLVEDMLTVSRIHSNRFVLNRESHDIVKTIRDIFDEYSIKAREHDIEFRFLNDHSELIVSLDVARIQQVYVNILGNALKFTPQRGTIITKVQQEEGWIRIAVSDTGPGIPADKLSLLFTKFGKIDESYEHLASSNGTGLGLYLSQEIMHLHGGQIEVQSEYGKGSTFTMALPIS